MPPVIVVVLTVMPPPLGAALVQFVPSLVSTFPDVPGAAIVNADATKFVPLPRGIVPVAATPPIVKPVVKLGVIIVGVLLPITKPEPVSSVIAERKLALDGVARNVATPVPRPLTPVLIGNPVAFVSTPLAGVPNAGATNTGDVSVTIVPLLVAPVMPPKLPALLY